MPHGLDSAMVSLTVKGTTALVRCWSLVLQAGRGTFRFTEHNRALVVDGNTYFPSDSIDAGAAVNQGDLSVPNTGVRGIISSGKLTEKMLREGTFNGADVEEFLVDWRFPFAGRTRYTKYRIGKVTWNDAMQMFEADLVGQSERLSNRVGEIYSRTCRWNLGDSDCTVNLATWTRTATVTSLVNEATFVTGTPSGGAVYDEFFNDGPLSWTNSNNNGLKSIVKRYRSATNLWEITVPPPTPIQVGDTLSAITGCNKLSGLDIDGRTVADGHCKNKFNNVVNFGGFPFMPTNDKLYMTPFAKRRS
jgi:uncharacterized phage protein (TIGR02218 family)